MKQLFKMITILFLFCSFLYAHPHTFIEVKPTVEMNKNKINKIHIQWVLDEMSSANAYYGA